MTFPSEGPDHDHGRTDPRMSRDTPSTSDTDSGRASDADGRDVRQPDTDSSRTQAGSEASPATSESSSSETSLFFRKSGSDSSGTGKSPSSTGEPSSTADTDANAVVTAEGNDRAVARTKQIAQIASYVVIGTGALSFLLGLSAQFVFAGDSSNFFERQLGDPTSIALLLVASLIAASGLLPNQKAPTAVVASLSVVGLLTLLFQVFNRGIGFTAFGETITVGVGVGSIRSEERRVGKECLL